MRVKTNIFRYRNSRTNSIRREKILSIALTNSPIRMLENNFTLAKLGVHVSVFSNKNSIIITQQEITYSKGF